MAIKAEELQRAYLNQLPLDQFPADHPERRFLQEELGRVAAFNAARKDGSTPVATEDLVIPTPEALSAQWKARWAQWGERIGATYDIPSLRATPEQLAEIYSGGRTIIYVPGELTSLEGLVNLGRMFPGMRSWATFEGTTVKSDQGSGYLAVEASLDAPSLGSDEKQLRKLFESQGRKGMTLPSYIVASQDSRLRTGHYLDEKTWSRLPGSRHGGSVVRARLSPAGRLLVHSRLLPQDVSPPLGGRSQEAIGA